MSTGIAEKISRTIAYMIEHVNQPLQISTLAAQANISPSHYFALFKRQTGSAPMDYFIRLRMRHARELLDGTALSVKEIAAELGYNDQFYFSRVFKAVNRLAPTEYRMLRRAASGEISTRNSVNSLFPAVKLPTANRRFGVTQKYAFARA